MPLQGDASRLTSRRGGLDRERGAILYTIFRTRFRLLRSILWVATSFHVDSLDPAYPPGTGTPEVGSLTPREAPQILRDVQGQQIIGGDVVAVAPQDDPTTNTAQVGAQMLCTLFCLRPPQCSRGH